MVYTENETRTKIGALRLETLFESLSYHITMHIHDLECVQAIWNGNYGEQCRLYSSNS